MDEVRRVGVLVGGDFAAKWAREMKLITAKLAEKSDRGPKGSPWATEAMRLKLACSVALIAHRNREGLAGAKALAAKLEELAGKALAPGAQREVLALHRELVSAVREEAESHRLSKKAARDPLENLDEVLEGKSLFFPSEQDADVERLLRAIGGYRERGAEPGPGGFDAHHLGRAMALIAGDTEPDGDAETRALERFRGARP